VQEYDHLHVGWELAACRLALMAQAAGLASEVMLCKIHPCHESKLCFQRNRTFFIDDTYWNRGKWVV